jgi:hypothetical protein
MTGMWWFKRQPEKPLREQLTDGREALVNQIAILEAGPIRPVPGEAAQMLAQAAELRLMLGEIEREMAEPEPPNT